MSTTVGPSPISIPYQAAYVTGNLDAAMALFRERYGIIDFLVVGPVAVDMGCGGLTELKVAMAYVDEFMYELIEPISGAIHIHQNGLPAETDNVVGFHHLAFRLPTLDALKEKKSRLAQFYDIPVYGEYGQTSAFFYADTFQELGHYLEYVYAEHEQDDLIPRHSQTTY